MQGQILTLAADGTSAVNFAPRPTYPRKRTPVPTEQEGVGSRADLDTFWNTDKSLPHSLGSRNRIVQPEQKESVIPVLLYSGSGLSGSRKTRADGTAFLRSVQLHAPATLRMVENALYPLPTSWAGTTSDVDKVKRRTDPPIPVNETWPRRTQCVSTAAINGQKGNTARFLSNLDRSSIWEGAVFSGVVWRPACNGRDTRSGGDLIDA